MRQASIISRRMTGPVNPLCHPRASSNTSSISSSWIWSAPTKQSSSRAVVQAMRPSETSCSTESGSLRILSLLDRFAGLVLTASARSFWVRPSAVSSARAIALASSTGSTSSRAEFSARVARTISRSERSCTIEGIPSVGFFRRWSMSSCQASIRRWPELRSYLFRRMSLTTMGCSRSTW